MTYHVLIQIISSVLMSAIGQIMLRKGMSDLSIQLAASSPVAWALRVAQSPAVVLGLALYGGSMVLWLMVLAKVEVSKAYPFMGLGFVITVALGVVALQEKFNMAQGFGCLLVLVGLLVINLWGGK